MATIAIDFDGVIHRYSRGWQDGSIYDGPVEGALEAINKLMNRFACVVISTRDPEQIRDWFIAQNFPNGVEVVPDGEKFWNKTGALGVTNRKLGAIAYIDDRGLRFTNWADMEKYFL